MNDTNTRSGADEPCNSAGAEHCANIGTGEKPAPGKRETPPAEKSRADALTDHRVQEIAEKFGITTANVRAFVDACAASPLEQPAAAPIPKLHCQNRGDVCLAGNRDGVCCPDDSCDIDDGVRKDPRMAQPAPSPADERAAFEECIREHCAPDRFDDRIAREGKHYVEYATALAWAAWQARAASANATGAEGAKRGTPEQIQAERKLTCEAIDGAIAFGYQNTNPPPSADHWLAPYWHVGRKQAELESRSPAMAAEAAPISSAAWMPATEDERATFDAFCERYVDAADDVNREWLFFILRHWSAWSTHSPATAAEAVAWVRKHPDTGELSGDWLWNDVIEQCRKDSGVWFPLGFLGATAAVAAEAVAIPVGWKAMPPSATTAMRMAMAKAAADYMQRTGGNSPDAIYEAGFAAAPQPAQADARVGLMDELRAEVTDDDKICADRYRWVRAHYTRLIAMPDEGSNVDIAAIGEIGDDLEGKVLDLIIDAARTGASS
ncbi:hypothetical protein BDI4_600041 [Burkholderia diffusa]|uniref:hypothetical protein n=1 Tax=Burkholderia diffusa TaxID=488732 RepID=UPI001CB216F3|nr:hypothetical protein [Burkholderia diffusa]CAG9259508.1 hypothetical protein BDI4_600041 [Burkholderia diffusa]